MVVIEMYTRPNGRRSMMDLQWKNFQQTEILDPDGESIGVQSEVRYQLMKDALPKVIFPWKYLHNAKGGNTSGVTGYLQAGELQSTCYRQYGCPPRHTLRHK